MMVMLNRTPTRPHPILSSNDLAKAYSPQSIRATKAVTGQILARPATGTEGHLRERAFGRVCWLVAGNPLHPCDAGFVAFSLSRNVLWWPNCSKHPCGANRPRGHIIAKMIDRMAVRTETDERQGIP